jgi:O-antigen/teichoic acid export membrane protein
MLGEFSLVTTTVLLVIYILGLDYYTYSLRKTIASDSIENKRLEVSKQFILYIILSIFFIAFAFPLALYLKIFSEVIYLLPFLIFFEFISQELYRLFNALKDIRIANFLFFIRNGLWIILYLPLDFYNPTESLYILLALWTFCSFLSVSVGVLFLKKVLQFKSILRLFLINPNQYTAGLKVASVFFVSTILLKITEYGNRYVLDYYHGKEQLGTFSLFMSIGNIQNVLCEVVIFAVFYPKLIEAYILKDFRGFRLAYTDALTKTILYNLAFITCVILFSGYVIDLIYPNTLIQQNQNQLIVISLANFLFNLSIIFHYILYAANKDKQILQSHVAIFLFSIVAYLFFVKYFEAWGAVIGYLVISALFLVTKYFFSRKDLQQT